MISFLLCLAILIVGYFVYGKIVDNTFGPDDRETPAVRINDGVDYVVMPQWKLFLVQLLNIAGLGPIFGAMQGALWGPVVFLWITFGTIFAGGVHDYFSGMMSERNDGASIAEITGKYLGPVMQNVMRVFSVVLLIMVGTVFAVGPAGLIVELCHQSGASGVLTSLLFWLIIILVYYFIATFISIDAVIGKIYPIFGICLIIMAIGVIFGIFTNPAYTIPEIWDHFGSMHPSGTPIWSFMFITVACGAISGFHSTQSPLMARCMKSEKQGHFVFYGAMVCEGVIALIWAAAGCSLYEVTDGLNTGLAQALAMGQSKAIYDVCSKTMGGVGIALAMIGVVVCPITSGDTAFRSARLTLADWFKIDQDSYGNRLKLCIPVLGVGLYLVASHAHPIFERVFKRYDRLNNVVQENLNGIRVVKSYNRESFEVSKFGRISQRIFKDFTKAERIMSFNSPLMMICIYGSMILIAWMGAQQIVASGNNPAVGLTTGDLTALVTYAMQILMAMMMLSMIFVMVIISQASAERICQVLQEESTVQNPAQPVTDMADGSIEFDHVTFRYSDSSEKPVLDDINLKIRSGMTVGIVGGTGSAKSSLVQLVPRLYDVSSGSLKVGGVDVRDYDLEALRDQVAMVLQKNVLFSGTIAENLRWGNPNATDEEIRHAAQLAQADGFVQEFPDKYDTYIEQGGTNVSGGQRQRLCIARALLKKPKILILDDSVSAVDTKTERTILDNLKKREGLTTILIAHRISTVEQMDKIVFVEDGEVHAVGKHEDLYRTCTAYRKMVDLQKLEEEAGEE